MKEFFVEYRKTLGALRNSKMSPLYSGSIISDTEWSIKLMETGHIPGTKWTVARWSREDRELPIGVKESCQ